MKTRAIILTIAAIASVFTFSAVSTFAGFRWWSLAALLLSFITMIVSLMAAVMAWIAVAVIRR